MPKMKIFISWSGPRSGAVAEALKEYLPMINNAFDPWLSSADIQKGSRSTAEIAEALATAKAGIICLTPNNLTEPWILFEAGGVAKTVAKPLACTLLIDLKTSDVSPPLGDFQHTTTLTRKELLQLVKTLNKALEEGVLDDAQIEKAFDAFWPKLDERFANLPPDGPTQRPQRETRELLEDVLNTVRSASQESTAMLTQIADAILDVQTRLIARKPLSGIGRTFKLANLLNAEPNNAATASPLTDAQQLMLIKLIEDNRRDSATAKALEAVLEAVKKKEKEEGKP